MISQPKTTIFRSVPARRRCKARNGWTTVDAWAQTREFRRLMRLVGQALKGGGAVDFRSYAPEKMPTRSRDPIELVDVTIEWGPRQ